MSKWIINDTGVSTEFKCPVCGFEYVEGEPNLKKGCNYFVAELEKNIITEAERCCDNCQHEPESPDVDPCFSCEKNSNWEEAKEW